MEWISEVRIYQSSSIRTPAIPSKNNINQNTKELTNEQALITPILSINSPLINSNYKKSLGLIQNKEKKLIQLHRISLVVNKKVEDHHNNPWNFHRMHNDHNHKFYRKIHCSSTNKITITPTVVILRNTQSTSYTIHKVSSSNNTPQNSLVALD